MKQDNTEHWDLVIKPHNKWYQVDLAAIWRYRDLLMLLVRRDFVSLYKQTILGPVWFFIQPLLTSFTFTFIFSGVANLSTDGNPPMLFYLAGITLWNYFSDCFTKTSNTFVANASVFGKVYFPRLIVPLSVLVSNLLKLGVQFMIFFIFWMYYTAIGQASHIQWSHLWLLPFLVVLMAGLGFGAGILISSLTTKYRDLTFLVSFGVQLLMYGSSVVIPISSASPRVQFIMLLNPLTSIIEAFKFIFLGHGYYAPIWLIYGAIWMLILLFLSIIVFNRVERSFMDTV